MMRDLFPAFVLVFVLAGSLSAQEESPKDLVERAINATATNRETLTKLKQYTYTAKGAIYSGMGLFKAESVLQTSPPEQVSLKVSLNLGGEKRESTVVMQGAQGFRRVGNNSIELSFDELRDMKIDMHGIWLRTLTPLTDGSVTLKSATAETIEGKKYKVLRVTKRLMPEVALYFDAESYLLHRMTYKGRDAGLNVNKEFLFSDFKSFDGIKLPTKTIEKIDGNTSNEWNIEDYKFPEKLTIK